MLRSMYSAISGMNAFQTQLDVVGNNIANVDTTGFKAGRVEFSDILSQTLSGASAPQNPGLGGVNPQQVGLGVNVASIDTLFTQGADQQTGVPTDVALDGSGLFLVSPNWGATGQQVYYTRAGNFQVDASGNLVLPNGMKLLGYNTSPPPNPPTLTGLSPVNISVTDPTTGAQVPGQFTISQNGTVTVTNPYTNATTTWTVPLANFFNPGGLVKAGGSVYTPSANSGAPIYGYAAQQGYATFRPGALEASNVNLTTEFTNMIIAQQGFDSNSKVINTDNNILATIQTLEQQA